MRFKSIALMAAAAVIAVAPQAWAFGSSSHHDGPTAGLYTASANANVGVNGYPGCSGGGGNQGPNEAGHTSGIGGGDGGCGGGNNGGGGGGPVGAAEPLSAFAVGLGLLGARYLRRRS